MLEAIIEKAGGKFLCAVCSRLEQKKWEVLISVASQIFAEKEVPCLYNNPSKYGAFDMLFKNGVTNRGTRLSKSFLNYVNVRNKYFIE